MEIPVMHGFDGVKVSVTCPKCGRELSGQTRAQLRAVIGWHGMLREDVDCKTPTPRKLESE